MKHTIARAAFLLLVLFLLAPAFRVGALALSGADPLLYANLDRADFEFSYVPQANSDYALCLFSADGARVQARAEILEEGEVIASGEGSGEICRAWLVEGQRYTVRVHGSGSAVLEMARCALSRSYFRPLSAQENEPSEKMIAHAYDAHWYRFEAAADGEMLLTCVPQNPKLQLSALLFDDGGTLIGEFERLSGGACRLLLETQRSRGYYVRICAPDGGEGYYTLNLYRPQGEAETLAFDSAEISIAAGSRADLSVEAGDGALLWVSDAPEIAAVEQSGVVHGLRAGEATITAYGMGQQASCRVIVEQVELQGVNIISDVIELNAGDEADIQLEFLPENASKRRVRFQVEDASIASVSRNGVLRALQPGETTVTVISADGALRDSARVVVAPAVRRYRALLVSEENYPFAENTWRDGSENSVSAIRALLQDVEFENAAYSVRTGKDLSRAELIAQIRETFRSATAQDVSLLYITCHGSYTGGMSFLELSDGSTLSIRDLERELRNISGTVVVMIDCCGSGGAIGAASDRIAFAKGVTGAFAGAGIQGSKYRVIASAGLDEDSFRIAFDEDAISGVMATVFARSLCDGAGWDIDRNERGTMGADMNYDGEITISELESYMKSRVSWYLDIASSLTGEPYRQSIQVYPEGDPLVLFKRKP